jgi:hypothetical protein
MKKQHIFFILLFLLTGCANNNVWFKPGASINEFNVDQYDCILQSQQKSDGDFVYRNNNIVRSGSDTDLDLFVSCMNAKGWSMQDSKAPPKIVARNSSELKQKLAIYEDTMNKFNEQVYAICAKPEYAAIIVKSACNVKDITVTQLADNTKMTPEQKDIFSKYLTEVNVVVKERSMYMHTLTNREDLLWADYLDSTQSEVDKYNLDLLNGVITWGEYNQRRKDLYAKRLSAFRRVFHRIY